MMTLGNVGFREETAGLGRVVGRFRRGHEVEDAARTLPLIETVHRPPRRGRPWGSGIRERA